MSKSSEVLVLIFFLVSVSVFSPRLLVYGSPVREQIIKHRADPLHHFKSYNGGYDIRNKHYWASVAFTGVHGYAIAGLWLLCGMGLVFFMFMKNPSSDHPPYHSIILYLLLFLFSFSAILAIDFVLVTSWTSLQKANKLKDTMLGAGRDAVNTIYNVTKAMGEMQHLLLQYDSTMCLWLNLTTHRLGEESLVVQRFVQKDGHSLDLAIQTLYIGHIVIVTINLIILVTAPAFLFLHCHPVIVIILFCWILATICWVLTGFDFFLYNFAEDTCSAFRDFVQNPRNNSLSSILPCLDSSHSGKLLMEIGLTIHSFITKLNLKLTVLHKLLGLDEQNSYLAGASKICDPFSGAPDYIYIPNNCPKDSIPITDLPNVLSRFTCYKQNANRACEKNRRFLPKVFYDMASAYTRSVQDLLNIYPDLHSLTRCSFVKNAVSDVVLHQCRPFARLMRSLWSWMLFLSIVMVLWVITYAWLAKNLPS